MLYLHDCVGFWNFDDDRPRIPTAAHTTATTWFFGHLYTNHITTFTRQTTFFMHYVSCHFILLTSLAYLAPFWVENVELTTTEVTTAKSCK